MLTARDPAFALGFAYLASVYTREYQYGPAEPTDASLLDRAQRDARRAVELTPESARAYQMLATVLFARREVASSFATSEKAIALNPYDMTLLSDYGGRLIIAGEIDRGMEMLSRAADEGALRPSWYRFYLFLGSYLKGDMASASRHAAQIASDGHPLGLLGRALAAASEGNRELARAAFDRLVAAHPAWRKGARSELGRIFPVAATADRLAADLVSAGLILPE
jgi:tetratricopeptide (TPR) repeat protein